MEKGRLKLHAEVVLQISTPKSRHPPWVTTRHFKYLSSYAGNRASVCPKNRSSPESFHEFPQSPKMDPPFRNPSKKSVTGNASDVPIHRLFRPDLFFAKDTGFIFCEGHFTEIVAISPVLIFAKGRQLFTSFLRPFQCIKICHFQFGIFLPIVKFYSYFFVLK